MAKRYMTTDGEWLAVCRVSGFYRLRWRSKSEPPLRALRRGMESPVADAVASKAVVGLARAGSWHDPLEFENRAIARMALERATSALLALGEKPLPKWAREAKDAGWTAPEGWRP